MPGSFGCGSAVLAAITYVARTERVQAGGMVRDLSAKEHRSGICSLFFILRWPRGANTATHNVGAILCSTLGNGKPDAAASARHKLGFLEMQGDVVSQAAN